VQTGHDAQAVSAPICVSSDKGGFSPLFRAAEATGRFPGFGGGPLGDYGSTAVHAASSLKVGERWRKGRGRLAFHYTERDAHSVRGKSFAFLKRSNAVTTSIGLSVLGR